MKRDYSGAIALLEVNSKIKTRLKQRKVKLLSLKLISIFFSSF